VAGEWGTSEHNRKARFYKITKTGRKLLSQETKHWEQATAVLERFLKASEDLA
jgi:DNA-binding PadR family transcriptional regulator